MRCDYGFTATCGDVIEVKTAFPTGSVKEVTQANQSRSCTCRSPGYASSSVSYGGVCEHMVHQTKRAELRRVKDVDAWEQSQPAIYFLLFYT